MHEPQVKLTPGKQKRGKASKQAIEVFSRSKDTPASQKSLMKGVTDNECVAAMIGDVKVAVAGLAQATQVRRDSFDPPPSPFAVSSPLLGCDLECLLKSQCHVCCLY